MSEQPRVLLVEDDASLQIFVGMALEELPLQLHCCASVGEALSLLHQQRYALIITDLMLPDASGRELLARLRAEPELRGEAPVVVFSAGLHEPVRAELQALGAWRLLAKPCALDELEHCVREGLALTRNATPPAAAAPDPVHAHFGGNVALYEAFRRSCLQQFAHDIQQGDAASQAQDAQTLRRLAHSLKSVLLTLGHAEASDLAKQLEARAEASDWAQALPLWQALRQALLALG